MRCNVLFILYLLLFWFFELWMLRIDEVFDLIVLMCLNFGGEILLGFLLLGWRFLLFMVGVLGWCVKGFWIGIVIFFVWSVGEFW